MGEITTVAERLRLVRTACQRFLGLWAMDCLLEGAAERFGSDVAGPLANTDRPLEDSAPGRRPRGDD